LSHKIRRDELGPLIGAVIFSRDGKLMAITPGRAGVRLVETATGRELATLAGNDQWPACFSPDGTQLIACGDDDSLKIWDLRLIRQELAAMHLDWEAPPLPPAQPVTAKRLIVSIVGSN
jgi:WD40 repeat protein